MNKTKGPIKIIMNSGKEYIVNYDITDLLNFMGDKEGEFCLIDTGVYIKPECISSLELLDIDIENLN